MNYYLEEAQLAMEKAIQVSEFYEDMEELNIREAECRALSAGGGSKPYVIISKMQPEIAKRRIA